VSKCRWACRETMKTKCKKFCPKNSPLTTHSPCPLLQTSSSCTSPRPCPTFPSCPPCLTPPPCPSTTQISLSPCPPSNSPCPPCPSHLPCHTGPSTTVCPEPTVQECKNLHSLNFCQECECLHIVPTKLQCDFYFPLTEKITPSLCLKKFPDLTKRSKTTSPTNYLKPSLRDCITTFSHKKLCMLCPFPNETPPNIPTCPPCAKKRCGDNGDSTIDDCELMKVNYII
jgi:hypothetical protein